jgi:hypothetical protein
MITPLTDIDPHSVRVDVYKNLRTGGWSIKTAERVGDVPAGNVIAHADELALTDCVFVTKPAAIARMVAGTGPREHKRNVFAWVTGKLADGQVVIALERVAFHPFERPDFFAVETGQTVTAAGAVYFDTEGGCWK